MAQLGTSNTAKSTSSNNSIITNGYKLHIAIDFGTDGLGLAYAVGTEVFVHSKWNSEKYRDVVKPKTIILLDKDGNAEKFGLDAKELYMKLPSVKDHLLFERFKMSLYDDTMDKAANDDQKSAEKKMDIKTELKAANGTLYSSEAVFVAALQHLEKQAKKFLRKQKIKVKKDEIQWIITVPAIWSDKAKNSMKQWLIKSGLVDVNKTDQYKIVYEPDCASLAIQHEIKNAQPNNDDNKQTDDDDDHEGTMGTSLDIGEKYILVDAGGGTVDVACHEILGEFGVKELLPPSGGPWGSCYIDDQYKETLNQIFGEELMNEFKNEYPNIYTEAMHNFQSAKQDFYAIQKKHHNCRLPDDFIAWLEEKFEDDDIEDIVANSAMGQSNLVTLNDEILEISNITWISMFDQVIDPTIEHIKTLLNDPKLKENCNYLCLVGGLSCSPYFKFKMEAEFGIKSKYELEIIQPKRPILAVVQGAAYFGITDNYIKARRLQKTYGIVRTMSLQQAKDAGVPLEYIEKNKMASVYDDDIAEFVVPNCFEILVHKNQEIITNQFVSAIYGRVSLQQKSIVFCLLSSNLENPKVVDDGEILGEISVEWNVIDIDKNVRLEYHFYDTMIKLFAYRLGPTSGKDNKKSIEISYANNNNNNND